MFTRKITRMQKKRKNCQILFSPKLLNASFIVMGCFPAEDMQTPAPSQKWTSWHKRCAMLLKLKMCWKLHITSYHVWALWVSKRGVLGPKNSISSKVAEFASKIGNELMINFHLNDFLCAIFSFWDMIDFVFFLQYLKKEK